MLSLTSSRWPKAADNLVSAALWRSDNITVIVIGVLDDGIVIKPETPYCGVIAMFVLFLALFAATRCGVLPVCKV